MVMELNINSPAYFTNQYGVIDEIYAMCREIRYWVKDKNYSPIVDIVGIVPIVAPKEIIEQSLWKERKECEVKAGFASVSLRIDYEAFLNANIEEKKKLMVNNILASVKAIHSRAKIDYIRFHEDILQYCKQAGIEL